MKLKKAIETLERQKLKLPNENVRTNSWLTQTSSLIKDLFGKDSSEYIHIHNFLFYSVTMDSMSAEYNTEQKIQQNKLAIAQFLDNCIETLKDKGVYKETKANFLSRLSDTALWTIIGTIFPLVFGASYYLGKREGDNKIEKIEIEKLRLKDSLNTVIKSISQPNRYN